MCACVSSRGKRRGGSLAIQSVDSYKCNHQELGNTDRSVGWYIYLYIYRGWHWAYKYLCTPSAPLQEVVSMATAAEKWGLWPWRQLGLTADGWHNSCPSRQPHDPQKMCYHLAATSLDLCLINVFSLGRWDKLKHQFRRFLCYCVFVFFKKIKVWTSPWMQLVFSQQSIFTCPVLTPTGAAEWRPAAVWKSMSNCEPRGRTNGEMNPHTSTEEDTHRETCLLEVFQLRVEQNDKRNEHMHGKLTWLMCLSLSMIWLMTGSGGLLLRDSEPGCDRFRPGPGNLKG